MKKTEQSVGVVPPHHEPRAPHNHPLRDWLAKAFGISPSDREDVVRGMLSQHAKGAVSYWFQLVLAMGISTLGLVLNSTGVIIGAMLIAPLMGPIVGVGMGLAIGSPYLFVRSLIRCLSSIVCVVGGSALLVLSLPFQEATTEIAARTSPTLLDLFVAIFCALAAAFTTVQRASEVASTAAGTSIGISLVPPLCVVGFGVGIGSYDIASGAALLFTANLCAILLFAALMFVVLGLDTVDALALEDSTLDKSVTAARVSGGLRALFGWRHGVWFRVLLPAIFIASIYAPLRQALEEVSWQVRVRSQIKKLIEELTDNDAVTTTLVIERRSVIVRLVLVEQIEKTKLIEEELLARITKLSGVIPSIEVTTVPNEEALQKVAKAIEKTAQENLIPPKPDPSALHRALSAALKRSWPKEAAGELISWELSWRDEAPTLSLVHLGAPLGEAARILLSQAISADFASAIQIEDRAINITYDGSIEPPTDWLPLLSAALESTNRYPKLEVCVTSPPPTPQSLPAKTPVILLPTSNPAVGKLLLSTMCRSPQCNLQERGELLSIKLSTAGCEPASGPSSLP